MRTILLIAVLIIGYTLAVCAQSNVLPDSGFRKFKMGKPGISSFTDSLNKGKLNVPFSTKNLYFHDLKDKELKMGQPAEGNRMGQKGMPVLRPKGSFRMPIYRPDSTVKYTLLIKEYKRVPSKDYK